MHVLPAEVGPAQRHLDQSVRAGRGCGGDQKLSYVTLTLPPVSVGGVDVGFAQRVKALACTAPLHDLDTRKTQVQTADFSVFQMSELALHAIDLVTLAMDFDAGAHPQRIVVDLTRYAAQQAPDRPIGDHERAARWVLENLLGSSQMRV